MLTGPTGFYAVAARLLADLTAALAASAPGAVDRACVVPGLIAADECDCGLLAISVGRLYLSDAFPAELTTSFGTGCSAAYVVGELTIDVFRCAPSPQGEAIAPTCAALDATARDVISDAYVVLTTAACTLAALDDADEIADHLIRSQTSLGPAGGCVGFELNVSVALLRRNP